ncbi:malonyl-CoA decarboxylase [Anaplasma bovis]|uniref:malonyl-CoA decarboxylase n=1 Tax=Anaplasma bovis TaxID=186733 RepID=UPI002FF3C047
MENSLLKIKHRTFSGVARVIDEVTDVVLSWVGNIGKDLSKTQDVSNLLNKMRECISPKGGEVKARHNTVSLGNLYLQLSDTGKARFLRLLNDHFSSERSDIELKIREYIDNTDDDLEEKLRFDLIAVLCSPRLSILKQFMSLSEGVKFLVDMRADVITLGKEEGGFFALERDLKSVLSSLFDVGLLELRHITWDSPASLLDKLVIYEAVHAISCWEDLRHRLDYDRRCFAFFHYKVPCEPLIFVEVALLDEIADNIQELLDYSAPKKDPNDAKVAVFYSISNTQVGLTGISLGNFLIKRVVSRLSSEFPNIKTYVTLSPIPGFTRWLRQKLSMEGDSFLCNFGIFLPVEELLSYIDSINSENEACIPVAVQDMFVKLCANYLNTKNGSKVIDPVAHFHLSNGASIKRLNWMADSSEKGISSSMGIMVNYSYELSKIDDNHESYVVHGKVMASKEVASFFSNLK